MTPKLRVQRFQRAVALARGPVLVDLARLAADCGYYEQAHMSRDFAEFARMTPGELLRGWGAQVKDHHVALT